MRIHDYVSLIPRVEPWIRVSVGGLLPRRTGSFPEKSSGICGG